METYYKTNIAPTQEAAEALLDAADEFINSPVSGREFPNLEVAGLGKIWNSGDRLDWEFSDETLLKKLQRESLEADAAAELEKLQADLEYFKDVKIRPWRNQKLAEWIDDTFQKPLKYSLTGDQMTGRAALHIELCDWPGLFTEYATGEEIDALKPSAPNWISS